MCITEKAVSWAKVTAADNTHGYSQANRWGSPDYDCSSFVISAYKQAGVKLSCTYTGNMPADLKAHGFIEVNNSVNSLQPGDILWHINHTAMYIGGGKIVQARTDTDGVAGDSRGDEIRVQAYYNYPWTTVYRYVSASSNNEGGVNIISVAQSTPTVPNGEVTGLTEIKSGTRCHDVKVLQTLLNAFYGEALDTDGIAGALTAGAVRRYQKAHGLTQNGVFSATEWAILLKGGKTV